MVAEIKSFAKVCKNMGYKIPHSVVLMDDLAGDSIIHQNRRGTFANFAIQTPHWNISVILITQQPSSVDPNYRDNAEHVIIYPSERADDYMWLRKTYGGYKQKGLRDIITFAWHGGKEEDDEWGLHFLYVQAVPRKKTNFYIDFDQKITGHS
jgi:hypothetical protein